MLALKLLLVKETVNALASYSVDDFMSESFCISADISHECSCMRDRSKGTGDNSKPYWFHWVLTMYTCSAIRNHGGIINRSLYHQKIFGNSYLPIVLAPVEVPISKYKLRYACISHIRSLDSQYVWNSPLLASSYKVSRQFNLQSPCNSGTLSRRPYSAMGIDDKVSCSG